MLEERRSYISTERVRLLDALRAMPALTPFESQGNFILIDVSRTGRTSTAIADFCKREGLVLLRAVTAHGLGDGHIRVTVGRRDENDLFLELIRRAVDDQPLPVPAATGA